MTNINIAARYEHEIPEGYEARIEGNKVIIELKESEDERIRKKLVHTVLGTPSSSEWFEDISKDKMLAYLEKQKEQKPAEWSEEDEKKISFLCGLLEHNLPEGTFAFGDGAKNGFILKQEAIEMLKSLRPQPLWKPSEEQMRCLLDCVSKAKEIHNASVGGYDAYRILASLYHCLNKL